MGKLFARCVYGGLRTSDSLCMVLDMMHRARKRKAQLGSRGGLFAVNWPEGWREFSVLVVGVN